MRHKVAILLSTFNGDNYLRSQLDSILHQTYQDFVLCIRDDGSTDDTQKILAVYSIDSDRVVLMKDDLGNVGVANSYRLLMESVSAAYYLFADQDDVWELNKLEALVKIAEHSSIEDEPYLLFSNMSVFDEKSGEKYDFFKKFKINHETIKNGLFQGTISGCLMLFNESARQRSLALNAKSNMLHDWDVLMTSYLFGKIELIDKQLIHHRMHDKNTIGQNLTKSNLILLKDLTKYFFNSRAYRKIELKSYFDYAEVSSIHINKQVRLTKDFFTEKELSELTFFRRKKWYLKHFNPFIYGKMKGLLILLTI